MAAEAAPRPRTSGPALRDDLRTGELEFWAFGLQLLVLIFLQKFVLPLSATTPISLPLVTLYGWIGFMILRNRLEISPQRLIAFGALLSATVISQFLVGRSFSTLSLLQFLLLYAPLMFAWRIPRTSYLRLMNLFQTAMLVGCLMVFLQLGSQAVLGLGNTLNMEEYVPPRLLLQGYNYHAPISWGAAFIRPNGFFFLEPSFASSFLACALVIELVFFHRLWRILVYAGALIGTMGATGMLMVIVAGPLLIARQNFRVALMTAVAGIVLAAIGFATGAFDSLVGRFSELSSPGSSAWQRLVAPLISLQDVFANPKYVVTGLGAGNNLEVNISTWPVVKVMVEYGALAGILFLTYVGLCMSRSPNRPLALALFVAFGFTGGFLLLPVTVIQIMFLICLLRIDEPPAVVRQAPRGRGGPARRRGIATMAPPGPASVPEAPGAAPIGNRPAPPPGPSAQTPGTA